MNYLVTIHLHCSQRPADACPVLFGGWTCMGADGAVAVVGCNATTRVPGCSKVIIGTPIAVFVGVALVLDMFSWVALDIPSCTALTPDFLHLRWTYRQRNRIPRTSRMIITISNGPIVPMLLSSRLISPKLLEVFSTSRFATLALHISAIHTELFQVVKLKRLILVLYLSEYVSAPTVHMVHMVLGESSWSVRTGSLERPVSQRLSWALV